MRQADSPLGIPSHFGATDMRLFPNSLYLLPLSYLGYSPQQVTFLGEEVAGCLGQGSPKSPETPQGFCRRFWDGGHAHPATPAFGLAKLIPTSRTFSTWGSHLLLEPARLLFHHHIPSQPSAPDSRNHLLREAPSLVPLSLPSESFTGPLFYVLT